MKKLLGILLLVASTQLAASVTSNLTLTTDYIWRGTTQANHLPAVQGGLDWSHDLGLAAGIWNSSLAASGETDFYGSYSYKLSEDLTLGLGYTYYYYSMANWFSFQEAKFSVSCPRATLSASYTDDYIGTHTASWYYNLLTSVALPESLGLKFSVGYTTFNNEGLAGMTNYLDYLVAITRKSGDFEFANFFTNTNRKLLKDSVESDLKEYTIGFSVSYVK